CGLSLTTLQAKGTIKAHFPLHDDKRRSKLVDAWLKGWHHVESLPYDGIKGYLGEKIGLYFAFLGHYTAWLAPLSVLGIGTLVDQVVEGNVDSTLTPYFSVFVALWAVTMLEFWKRKESRLAMRWGMSDFEESEQNRPQFKGDTMVSYIDGRDMTFYPPEEQLQLMILANLAIILVLCVVIAALGIVLYIKDVWRASSNPFLAKYGTYIGSFLLSVEIQLMNLVYKKIAVFLTEWENHRTDTQFEDNLISKLFLFQFVNSYASLYYMAFIESMTRAGCIDKGCMFDLMQSMAIIFTTRLVVANAAEI
ncbi:unnamed protein product, partial [Discosporangium mesarthrocarpum]